LTQLTNYASVLIEDYNIFMSSLAQENSMWSPWSLLDCWSRPFCILFIIFI